MQTLMMREPGTRQLESSGRGRRQGAFRLAFATLLALLVVTSLPTSANAATLCANNTITGNVTLKAGVYNIPLCTLTAGSTLTLNPGVIIKMNSAFNVRGTLIARGQPTSPVVFTSYRDDAYGGDTNKNGPSAGAPADWVSINLQAGAAVDLDYAVVRYGGKNSAAGMIRLAGIGATSLRVTNSTISNAKRRGIDIRGISQSVYIDRTQFLNNGETGLHVFARGKSIAVTVTNNTFTGNGTRPVSTGDQVSKYAAGFVTSANAPITSGWNISNNQGSGNRINAMYIEGFISGTETLASNGLPYVSGGFGVRPGGTLNLNPGVVMKFNFRSGNLHDVDTGFMVDGQINLNGTAAQPVILTSYYDDAYGGNTDGTATAPRPGDWHKIWLRPGASGTISNAILRYGSGDKPGCSTYGCAPANIVASGNSLTVSNSLVEKSKASAIQVRSGTINVSNSQFNDNAWNGLDLRGDGSPALNAQVLNNSFSNNGKGSGITLETQKYPIYIYTLSSTNGQINGNQVGAKANALNGIYLDAASSFNNMVLGANPGLAYVTDYTKVLAGKTMQLGQGAVLKFRYSTSHLNILGTLNATGAVFTSFADDAYGGDTNVDNGAERASARGWDNLMYFGGGTLSLNSSSVLWGGSGGHGCLTSNGGTLSTSNSVISCP